jgi:xanthine/uracil permease
MTDRQAQFRRRIVVTAVVMLTGISLTAVPHVLQVAVPSWWKPMTTLMILCGAITELLAVWSVSQRPD